MTPYQPPHPVQEPDGRHEESDVSGRGFLIFVVLFGTTLGLITLGLLWLLRVLASTVPQEPASAVATRVAPPEPRLQASFIHPNSPGEDLRRMRQQDQTLLETYGWVDRQQGIVRVPIDRAMQIYIQQGAPAAGFQPTTRPAASPSSLVPTTGGTP